MARRKPTPDDLKEREQRAAQMRQWMKDNLFTEQKLAEVLGISRRTVQMIRAAAVTPNPDTLGRWNALRSRYANGREN